MTLIAHGILALDKAIKHARSLRDPNDDRRYNKYYRARKRLEKLEDFEDKLGATGRWKPLALEIAAGWFVATGVVAVPAFALYGVSYFPAKALAGIIKNIKDKKREKAEIAKADALKKAKQQEQQKIIDGLVAEENKERKEVDFALSLIKNALAVDVHKTNAKDSSAIIAGLTNLDEKAFVANVLDDKDQNYFMFLYDFNDKRQLSVFFKNPETGNFEQLISINSVLGIKKIRETLFALQSKKEQAKMDTRILNADLERAKSKLTKSL